jgi:hypothetical protein
LKLSVIIKPDQAEWSGDMDISYDLETQIVSVIAQIIIYVGFIYGVWKVYHSRIYKEAIRKEMEFREDSIGWEIFFRILFLGVFTFVFAIVTVLVPLGIFLLVWTLIF